MATNNGIVRLGSSQSVSDVLEHLLSILQAKAIKVFAVIDHSGEAATVGLDMNETKLVVFGNPRAGTPLMIAAPDIALDLPLKILIAADANGQTIVTYTDPAFMQARYGLSAELAANIAGIEQIASALAG